MQQNEYSKSQEDEIDLKELFLTLWKNRVFILLFTLIITILSIVYAYIKTPIFEAKAVVKIGQYIENNVEKQIEDSGVLGAELNVLFIDLLKNEKDKITTIEKINPMKKQKEYLEIVSNSISNELATKEIDKVVVFIKEKHKKILDDVLKKKELEILELERKVSFINSNKLVSIQEEIDYKTNIEAKFLETRIIELEAEIKNNEKYLENIEKNISKIKSQNSSLAALNLIEQKNIETLQSQLKDTLITQKIELQNILLNEIPKLTREKQNIYDFELKKLYDDISLLKANMMPHNYSNSEIVGKILISESPIKPKKKLIVVVAFITGFIFSIFLVFFMQFIRSFKQEKINE